jgi:tripartite-type tricarboxylate transporter receptor subunit TctC
MFSTSRGVVRRFSILLTFLCATFAVAHVALAQPYPSKQVRIIVPYTPGGSNDVLGRMVAKHMQEALKQPFIVENKPGAAGQIGAEAAAKSAPDGYTLLVAPNDVMTVTPNFNPNGPYDPVNDFEPIGTLGAVPIVLVVNASSPYKSVAELVAAAKAKPGALSYASSGAGGPQHMSAELFASMTGVKMLHVPYKGNAQAIVDVISGQVTLMFDQVSTSTPHIAAGKLRGLAVTSLKRSPLLPELPTIDESGMRGFEDITFNGLVAPAGIPRAVLARLNADVAKAVATPELRQRFIQFGVELTASASPEAFMTYIQAEFVKKAKLAREAGIKLE